MSGMQSQGVGKVAEALAAAQRTIKAPAKNKTAKITSQKGSYSYKYADLSDCLDAIREPLSANGLAISQAMRAENGHIVLRTVLLHSSGEWLASEYPMAVHDRAQDQGSAITYARRYSICAIVGIAADEDDDAAHEPPRPRRAESVAPPDEMERVKDAARAAGIVTVGALNSALMECGFAGLEAIATPGDVERVIAHLNAKRTA